MLLVLIPIVCLLAAQLFMLGQKNSGDTKIVAFVGKNEPLAVRMGMQRPYDVTGKVGLFI